MTVWVARAGKYGERENLALDEGRAFIGWPEVGDLSGFHTKAEIEEALEEVYPDTQAGRLKNHAGQIYNFCHTMQIGDLFALPLKTRPAIAFGKISSDYQYLSGNPEDARHSRKISWIGEPIPRSRFDQDLLYSFGSALTVFTVWRNDAESRIRAIVEGKAHTAKRVEPKDQQEASEAPIDILSLAQEQISDFIGRKFKGHRMEELVAAILQAQGFTVRTNKRKGSDGGADILAGKGTMGFDEPRLCVQVKSGDEAIGSKDYDELKGVMQKFGAKHGLYVSWGGFKSTVEEEARRDFFNVRLWTGEQLVRELQGVYDNLPSDWQVELPLQRGWVLVG